MWNVMFAIYSDILLWDTWQYTYPICVMTIRHCYIQICAMSYLYLHSHPDPSLIPPWSLPRRPSHTGQALRSSDHHGAKQQSTGGDQGRISSWFLPSHGESWKIHGLCVKASVWLIFTRLENMPIWWKNTCFRFTGDVSQRNIPDYDVAIQLASTESPFSLTSSGNLHDQADTHPWRLKSGIVFVSFQIHWFVCHMISTPD